MGDSALRSNRVDFWVPISAAVSFFALCLIFMPRSIGFGDSGEIAAAATTLGIAHPPGHPGYLFPAWFWTTLFGGRNPGFVLNIFSAVIACANIVVLCRLLKTAATCFGLTHSSRWIRLAVVMAWSTLPFVWHYATNVEVYQLQWLWLFLFFDSFLKLGHSGEGQNWTRTWIWLGLAITVHPYSVFFAVFPLVFLLLNRSCFRFKWLLWPGLSAAATMLMYLALPLLSLRQGAFQWPRDEGFGGWLSFFLARDFSDRAATGRFLELLNLQWNTALPQVLSKGIVPILVLGGAAWVLLWFSKGGFKRRLGIVFLFSTLGFWILPFFSWALRFGMDQMIYFFCPLVLLLGAAYLAVETLVKRMGPWRHLGALVFVLVIASSVKIYDGVCDRSDNVFPLFLAQCITFNVPADSLIIVKDDESYFPLLYFQFGLGKRQDLAVFHIDQVKHHPGFFKAHFPHINLLEPLPENPRDIVASLVNANVHRRNVYWFGEDPFIAGIQGAVRYDHLVWFNPKQESNPFRFVSFYRGLSQAQRHAYRNDQVAQRVLGGIIQRIVFSMLSEQNVDQAQRLAEDWLKLNQGDEVATDLLARIFLIKGDKKRAGELVDGLLVLDEIPVFGLQTKSILLKSDGKWKQRRDLLAQHPHHLKTDASLAQDYAETLIQLGRFDKARRFLDGHPLKDALLLARVDLMYHSGEPEPAIELLEQYVISSPWDQSSLELLIYLCTIEGDETRKNRWTVEFQTRFGSPVEPSNMNDTMILRELLR